ncbi:MAG: 50S ribosomal protein L24 [Desulfohalobiaceae bacterium]
MHKYRIKVNDKVMIRAGKDKGKIGSVKKINKKNDTVLVDQLNMVKRHVRGNPHTGQSGGIQEKESPVHYSNVDLVCDSCTKPTRVGYSYTEDGRKYRYCKKCKEMFS